MDYRQYIKVPSAAHTNEIRNHFQASDTKKNVITINGAIDRTKISILYFIYLRHLSHSVKELDHNLFSIYICISGLTTTHTFRYTLRSS